MVFLIVEHNKKGIYKIRCPNCESKKSPIIFCHKETVSIHQASLYIRNFIQEMIVDIYV